MDYFISMVSYDWSLKHLKYLSITSIMYAVCTEEIRTNLYDNFYKKWDVWVNKNFDWCIIVVNVLN